jgi:2'-5' RNA ligase
VLKTRWVPGATMEQNKDEGEEGRQQDNTSTMVSLAQMRVQMRKPRQPLTHFICLILASDTNLTSELIRAQDVVIKDFQLPARVRVNVMNDLHVTVTLLSLSSAEAEARALQIFEALKHLGPPRSIDIGVHGIDRFGESVLWARPVFPNGGQFRSLLEWRKAANRELKDLILHDRRPFIPHATIAKTSRLGRGAKTAAITDDIVKAANALLPEPFPPQRVSSLTLLSCRKDSDGRYIRCGEVQFSDGPEDRA